MKNNKFGNEDLLVGYKLAFSHLVLYIYRKNSLQFVQFEFC